MSGKAGHNTVDPPEDDLPAPQVANPLHPQPQRLQLGQQGLRVQVNQVPRQVEGQPAVAEDPGLQAGRVRHGDDKRSAGDEQGGRVAQRASGLAEVLKRMPEDDGRPGPVHLVDLGVADVRPGGVRLKADGLTPAAHEGLDEGPVAGSHVQHRAGWQDRVQATGKRRASAAKHPVAEAGEPARLRAVPIGVGRAQLVVARPGRRGGHAAAGAPHPAGETAIGAVEPVLAPGALGARRRLGARIRQGVVVSSRQQAVLLAFLGSR
jgi:hypothetical protein